MADMSVIDGFHQQAAHCAANNAPATAAVVRAMIPLVERGDTLCGARMAAWPRGVIDDALPLRLAGGLHHLARRGDAGELWPVYRGAETDQPAVDAIVAAAVARHDAELAAWLDSPPQTNEAGRSANFIAAMHWLTAESGASAPAAFDCLEIGSSAGMNLLIDRFRYDLAGVISGPDDSPVTIQPRWDGPPPPAAPFAIARVRGCDRSPIDVRDDAAADRLRGYVWPEQPVRFARLDAGIAMVRAHGIELARADAADWVEARLAEPPHPNTTRVLMHSIVWQYLPSATQHRITAAMEAAGQLATAEQPLAWIALETNRATLRHVLRVQRWPHLDGAQAVELAEAQAHGAWVRWYDAPTRVSAMTP